MNTNLNKYFSIIIIALLVIVSFTLGIYLLNFHGGFSSDHGFWGNFGNYFGGVVTPLASIATLIWLLLFNNHQWRQGIDQIERVEKDRTINNLEFYLHSCISSLQLLTHTKIEPPDYNLLLERIISLNHEIIGYKIKGNSCIVFKNENKIEILRDQDVFSLIHFSIGKIGKEYTKTIIYDNNLIGQKNIILSFLGSMSYLLAYLTRLKNRGYDQLSIKYTLTLFNEYYKVLFEIGIVERNHYRDFMLLRDYPYLEEGLKSNLIDAIYSNLMLRDKKYSHLSGSDIKLLAKPFNENTFETKYIYGIEKYDEYFIWDSNHLSKISKEDLAIYLQ